MTYSVKSMMQAIRAGEALTSGELREMLIRHILVEPFNRRAAATTACLIDAWANVAAKDGTLDIVDQMGALLIFSGHIPESIPDDHPAYPRQVLLQVKAGLQLRG